MLHIYPVLPGSLHGEQQSVALCGAHLGHEADCLFHAQGYAWECNCKDDLTLMLSCTDCNIMAMLDSQLV